MVKRIVANVVDFDMHNLFPTPPLLEALKEEPGVEVQPKKQYQTQPLILQPDYSGDFLNKLRTAPFEGKAVEGASNENLWDFSMPEEWLKHQEEPTPRILIDDWYETSRPGEGAGAEDLKQYWDRGWDPNDAPQISEDLLDRNGPEVDESTKFTFHSAASRIITAFEQDQCECHKGLDPSIVVANWLMDWYPLTIELPDNIRLAKKLGELQNAMIHGKKPVSVAGVTVRKRRADPKMGRWVFTTGSHNYTTVFQFVPKGKNRSVMDLDVRVSCTCPSWVFWGAQYNAYKGDYLAGNLQLAVNTTKGRLPATGTAPFKRDKEGTFLVCKHVLACIPIVSQYKVGIMPTIVKKRLSKPFFPKVKIPKGMKLVFKVPPELKGFGRQSDIRRAVQKWNDWSDREREQFIKGLSSPGAVSYFSYVFPESASQYVLEKLKDMATKGTTPSGRKWANVLLQNLLAGRKLNKEDVPKTDVPEEKPEEEEAPVAEMPDHLKHLEQDPGVRKTVNTWEKMNDAARQEAISEQQSPDALAYLARKMPDTTGHVMQRLKMLAQSAASPEDRHKAKSELEALLLGEHRSPKTEME